MKFDQRRTRRDKVVYCGEKVGESLSVLGASAETKDKEWECRLSGRSLQY